MSSPTLSVEWNHIFVSKTTETQRKSWKSQKHHNNSDLNCLAPDFKLTRFNIQLRIE